MDYSIGSVQSVCLSNTVYIVLNLEKIAIMKILMLK